MAAIVGLVCAATLLAVSLLAGYQWALAAAAAVPARARHKDSNARRFLVLIPAHEEEGGLASTLRSFEHVEYPAGKVRIVVVADRCTDRTAAVARASGAECLERSSGPGGKGSAIAWAIHELRSARAEFDALVVVDADTAVDPHCLEAFNDGLGLGQEVQQAYNYISNPWESPFTRIIAATSVLRNGLFYAGKARLGIPSMLTGTGMCFSRRVIEHHPWTAFSVGEDWQFSIALLLSGVRIDFNPVARVLARESRDLRQASSQRLRWASGRHAVAATSARELFETGLRMRRWYLWDAALTILAPTYSAQATLAILCLVIALFLSRDPTWHFLSTWAAVLIGSLGAYFLLGIALTEAPIRSLAGIVLIPAFLPWRMAIELLGLLGYGRKRWVRTSRLPASR